MSPTRSVLLDLDGTLIDSQPGVFASCLAALRALGHDPGEALDIKHAIGPPLDDMFQALLRAHGDDRISEAVAAYRHHYGESGLLGSEPLPWNQRRATRNAARWIANLRSHIEAGSLCSAHLGESKISNILRRHLRISARRETGL